MILYENKRSDQKEYLYHVSNECIDFQKHAHYSFELISVSEGEITCEVGEETYVLGAGMALMILPGQIHSYRTSEFSRSDIVIFSNDMVESFYAEISGCRLSRPVFSDAERFIDELKCDSDIFMKKSVLYHICSVVYSQSELLKGERYDSHLAGKLAFHVQNNFRDSISLRQIAGEYGYNYTYLSSFFNKVFGENFSAYVNSFRLQYAAHLLEKGDMNITETVSECGFSGIRNFNIAFRNRYGLTPREYRDKYRNQIKA